MDSLNLTDLEMQLQNFSKESGHFWQTQWDKVLSVTGEDPFRMWIFGTTIYTMAYYWIFGAFFTFMDVTGRPKFLRRFKVQPGTNEPVETKKLLYAISVVLFNQIFVALPLAYLAFSVAFDCYKMPPIRELPPLYRFLTDIPVCVLLTETGFYYSHRLLHNKYVYKRVHKKHHEWISPISITAEYCHPIEHILSNLLPIFLGVVIMKCHFVTAMIWFSMAITSTMCHHSGYWLPLALNPEFHDFHHLKFNYCYGVTGLLDHIHGTDSLFRKMKAEEKLSSKKSK